MADTKSTADKDRLELLPPVKDRKVGYAVFEILGEILADKATLGLPTKWRKYYAMGRNVHWKTTAKDKSLISANLLFTHRQRTINSLTENHPTFNITRLGDPNEEKLYEIYEKLLKTAEYWWNDQEQQSVLEDSIYNGETYGLTVEKSIFNPVLEYGIGEVETVLVDPFHFGWYPVKEKDPARAQANLHFYAMSVREARRRWPHVANQIQADKEYLEELGDSRREISGGRVGEPKGYYSTFGGIVKHIINIFSSGKGMEDELLVVEAWVKDYTRENGKDKYAGNIRCVTCCNGGKVVLEDRSNPSINPRLPIDQAINTYLYDKFPFNTTPSVRDTSNGWGMSDFEQLSSLNQELDKALSQFTLVKDKASRIKFINPKDANVPNSAIDNAPGILNPANSMAAAAMRYIDPPKIDPYLLKAIEIFKDLFFLVAGTFELEAAQTPGREVIAYKAIAALLERAGRMLRGKDSNYGRLIRVRGRMYLSHVQNWYTEERWISYEQDGEEMSMAIRGNTMVIPAKLTVVSGSTMPVSKVQQREEAISLFQQNAIDQEELLKRLEWPDRKNVLKRMRAGIFGILFERLAAIGAPEQLIGFLQELSQMDAKDFDRALEKGEIPPFQALLPPPEKEGEAPATSPSLTPVEEAEIDEKQANIAKTEAERELILEKINTERVEQAVKMQGIEFDEEKLKIERAKIIADATDKQEDKKIRRAETITRLTKSAEERGTKPFREKGMKSDNEEV